jgi:acetolactate synthase-1/2/3 large subunit
VPTVLVTGDGGVAMYLAEAKLAAQHKLPLLIVLMTDNAFGSIRTRAIKDGLTQKPLVMDGKSWVGIFDSLGIPGTRAENPRRSGGGARRLDAPQRTGFPGNPVRARRL